MGFARRRLFVFAVVAGLLFTCAALAQGPDPMVPPEGVNIDGDWLYGQHYAQVQEIMKLPLGEREAALEHFYAKLDPKTKIHGYMSGFFQQVVSQYKSAGKTAEADRLQAKMLELFPELKPSPAQQLQAAFDARNYQKAIQIGEPLYAQKPDKQSAFILAQSYIATKNGPKAAEYSQKVVQLLGPKDAIYFIVWLADYYSSQRDIATALRWYDRMFKAFPDTVPPKWDSKLWSQTLGKGHLLKARDQYAKENYKGAIESFYTSLEYSSKNPEAYLAIGLSHWKLKEMDEAMGAFAAGTVLGSAKSKEYLEQIYKSRNKGTLVGIEKLLEQARAALAKEE